MARESIEDHGEQLAQHAVKNFFKTFAITKVLLETIAFYDTGSRYPMLHGRAFRWVHSLD
jgi:hypothetical protein